ncbi:hypothetical protein RJ55_00630 [Drechmeria coniospora]|nr:hypothetical protein RJ55_00630 [Drechmeria coniospora]
MMLTHTQPSASFGYKSVHDLPTPPSTSRPSPPPLGYQEAAAYKTPKPDSRTHSPVLKLMSASHRGLPPPAAMALASQQSSSAGGPPHQPHHHSQPSAPPVHGAQHGQPWAALPPPPQQWQGAEESMKNWLVAKAEEEKTKQEEERTRQESLRLEQRRVEMDMLRASLGGGIPPPMVPLVFAGMTVGGPMHQATLEWAQQFMPPPQGQQHPPLLRSQRPDSPDHRHRDGAQPAHGQHGGPSAGAAPAQASASFGQYPGSPARPRGQTVSGAIGRLGSAMAGHGTNPSQSAQPGSASMLPYQAHAHGQAQAGQQDASTSIYFHHWQPPTSQAGSGSSNRPGTPSAGEPHKKRRMTGPQQHPPPPSENRSRSPPHFIQSSLSNPPPGRRLHKRQKSDVSWYRVPGHGHGQLDEADRASAARALTPSQEGSVASSRDAYAAEGKKHSVSAMLSQDQVTSAPHEASRLERLHFHSTHGPLAPMTRHRDDDGPTRDRHPSPGRGGPMLHGGAVAGSAEGEH